MITEDTYKNLPEEQRREAVMQEMLPFFFFAAIPIIITIAIAKIFGPSIY